MSTEELKARFEELKAKKWVDNQDRPVRFLGWVNDAIYPFVVAVQVPDTGEEFPETVTKELAFNNCDKETALKEVPPYADWKIDDKIWVWDLEGQDKDRAHFAGVAISGSVLVWRDGKTSFTGNNCTTFNHAELAYDYPFEGESK